MSAPHIYAYPYAYHESHPHPLNRLFYGYIIFYLALTLGGIIAASSAIYLVIISMKNAEDARSVAVPTIQSLWISTSMGLGYVVTAYAPYFKYPFTVATALFALGWVILGVRASRATTNKQGQRRGISGIVL